MSIQITTAFVQQFRTGVDQLVQQKKSRLRGAVRLETGIVGKTAFFDQIGATAAVERTARHAPTPQIDTPHARRRVTLRTFDWADKIDNADKIRTLNQFASPYQMNGASAMGRSMDDVVIEAFYATAATGETGTGTASLATANTVVWGSSGLTIAKLLAAKEILDAFENDPEEERYIALHASQVTDLLNTTQVTSADFNTVRALAAGQLDTYMGFKFIRIERLPLDSGGQRRVVAWRKSAMCLAIGADLTARIDELPTFNYSTQVYLNMDIGATRMEESGVVDIRCTV